MWPACQRTCRGNLITFTTPNSPHQEIARGSILFIQHFKPLNLLCTWAHGSFPVHTRIRNPQSVPLQIFCASNKSQFQPAAHDSTNVAHWCLPSQLMVTTINSLSAALKQLFGDPPWAASTAACSTAASCWAKQSYCMYCPAYLPASETDSLPGLPYAS